MHDLLDMDAHSRIAQEVSQFDSTISTFYLPSCAAMKHSGSFLVKLAAGQEDWPRCEADVEYGWREVAALYLNSDLG